MGKKQFFLFLLMVFTCHGIALADQTCSLQNDFCPGFQTYETVCLKSCTVMEEGKARQGHQVQLFVEPNQPCAEGYEPVPGKCQAEGDGPQDRFIMNPATSELQVQWNCAQNPAPSGSGNLPTSETFSVYLNHHSSYAMEIPFEGRLEEIFNTANTSSIDYFSCLDDVVRQIRGMAEEACNDYIIENPAVASGAEDLDCGEDLVDTTVDQLWSMASEIGQRALERGARSPELMGQSETPLSERDTNAMVDMLSKCKMNSLRRDEDFRYLFSDQFMNQPASSPPLRRAIQGANNECREEIQELYLMELAGMQLRYGNCQSQNNPRSPSYLATNCQQVKTATTSVLTSLQGHFGSIANLDHRLAISNQVIRCVTNAPDPARSLTSLSQQARMASDCLELDADPNSENSGGPFFTQDLHPELAGRGQEYTLMRNGNNYTALLNLNFLYNAGSAGDENAKGVANADKSSAAINQVSDCLDEMNPYLQGPDGQTLQIQLAAEGDDLNNDGQVDENDEYLTPAPIDITIHQTNERADSYNWEEDMECSVMMHELMHLFGLADEYHENAIGYHVNPDTGEVDDSSDNSNSYNYDCRVQGPENSLMSNHDAAVEYARRNRRSLLHPAHFNAIVHPGCQSINNDYYGCAMDAYMTSRGNYDLYGCQAGRPAVCESRNPETWLGGQRPLVPRSRLSN